MTQLHSLFHSNIWLPVFDVPGTNATTTLQADVPKSTQWTNFLVVGLGRLCEALTIKRHQHAAKKCDWIPMAYLKTCVHNRLRFVPSGRRDLTDTIYESCGKQVRMRTQCCQATEAA